MLNWASLDEAKMVSGRNCLDWTSIKSHKKKTPVEHAPPIGLKLPQSQLLSDWVTILRPVPFRFNVMINAVYQTSRMQLFWSFFLYFRFQMNKNWKSETIQALFFRTASRDGGRKITERARASMWNSVVPLLCPSHELSLSAHWSKWDKKHCRRVCRERKRAHSNVCLRSIQSTC